MPDTRTPVERAVAVMDALAVRLAVARLRTLAAQWGADADLLAAALREDHPRVAEVRAHVAAIADVADALAAVVASPESPDAR